MSTYYRNKQPTSYPLSYVTLYEQGCKTPILAAANKFVYLDGIDSITMKQDVSEGYKLRVCIKMEFTNNAESDSSSVTSLQDTASGSTTTSDTVGKVAYTLTQDNIVFKQEKQPPKTVTKLQITK